MSKQIYHYFKKPFSIRQYIGHVCILLLVGSGFFSIIQTVFAQIPTGFLVTDTQNTGDYTTTRGYGNINFSGTGLPTLFQRSWDNVTTKLYEPSGNTIYFNNFDTPEVLEQNQVPLADSIRDFPDENFTGGTVGTGNNGWRYLYITGNSYQDTYINLNAFEDDSGNLCNGNKILANGDFLDVYGYSGQQLLATIGMTGTQFSGSDIILGTPRSCVTFPPSYLCYRLCTFTGSQIPISEPYKKYYNLIYSGLNKIRQIGSDPITIYNFANIGKKYAHPGSGTINSLPALSSLNNIPVIRQRTSNVTGKMKIINTLSDDENNCGSGIIYNIYTGIIEGEIIRGISEIKSYTLQNLFPEFTIEQDVDVNYGDNIFFEIDNNGNNECDGTWNWIQIYDITDNSGITGGPSYTENGKFGGALDFTGSQLYSLGTGINQSTTSGITIAAWINTRNKDQSQGIITKKFSYGIVLKQGTLRISPSTYWMRHDTGIPISSNTRTHVAWTYNGSTMRAYKNGSQIRTYNINGSLNGNEELAMIGYDELNQRGRNGLIDEFRMYDTAFTTGQIQQLYESNLKLVNSGANSSWNFIINKTGLVDNKYLYTGMYTKGILLGFLRDILADFWPYITDIPTCSNCIGDICNTGTITNTGYYRTNNYVCKAPNTYYDEQGDVYFYRVYNIDNNNITGSILVDQNGPILTGQGIRSVTESQPLTLTTTRYDSGMAQQLTEGFDRGRGWNINGSRDIATNTGNTMNFGRENEPINKQIKIRITDHVGNISYKTGVISWSNTGPVISDTKNIYTGLVEDNIIFAASGYDTGSSLFYKRYSGLNCSQSQVIIGATQQTYITGSDSIHTGEFSYKIFDQQGSGSICWNITGAWKEPNTNNAELFNNKGINLNGLSTGEIELIGNIIFPGEIGVCNGNRSFTNYTGYGIGNDYCIIQIGSEQIVIGRYGVNRYHTLFKLTGEISTGKYIITESKPQFKIDIQNTSLTGFHRSIHGINTTRNGNEDILAGLIGLYNFDKILLADSARDFSAIQSGKNWTYMRRPKGTSNYTGLQYYVPGKQRVIGTPIGTYDGLFIEKDELNPGYNYGDAIIGRKSLINSKIEIQYTLTDANTSCGDGIKYTLLKETEVLATGSFETKTITTDIRSGGTIYLVVNSINNNECDNTNYNIKIYQLPETNLAIEKDHGINSGAVYASGKYYGALNFSNNKYIDLGTSTQSGNMSISAWVYKGAGDNQTIIQKRGSYGIVIYNNKLQVTNQNTIRRYDTQISIPENIWTHIGRSYNGTHMKVYINGKEQRSGTVIGTIPNNSNSTYVGWSFSNGGRNGLIDEIYIYDYAIDNDMFGILYEHNLNKIARDRWQWISNQSGSVYDGYFDFTLTINDKDEVSDQFFRDFNPPLFTGIIGLTGWESEKLTITGSLNDIGSQVSGYQLRWNINNVRTNRSDRKIGTFIETIPLQDEPIIGTLEIKANDIFGHEALWQQNIVWINTGPIITNNQIYEYSAGTGSNITFIADSIDTGSNLTYKRYSGHNCSETLFSEINSTFTTGSNIDETKLFSFKVFDNYQIPSSCINLTGTRTEETSFVDLTVYLTGDGIGSIISGNRNNIGGSQTGKTILVNGQKGVCSWTGDKTQIIYTRSKEHQGNDSCIIQLDNNEYVLLAFIDISTGFLSKQKPQWPEIINNQNNISLYSTINTPEIHNFVINIQGKDSQGSGIINKTISGQDTTLLRKYAFDRTLITDSTNNFSKFENEYSWKYFWDNGTITGNFTFNPRTQSWIINEPLQNYEYIFISKDSSYPGATKYGKIVYQRTSNVSGSIDIENTINNVNPGYCTTTDGIIYTIKKGGSYENSNIVYSKNLPNLTENSTITTTINSGQKLYFIIDSKNNNQCDKISFNSKIYLNPIYDFSSNGQTLQTSGINYNPNGKFGGAYDFNINQSYINIGTINKQTGLSFSTWIKINSTANQTILHKQGSYGLAIKDGALKVTTDGGRWYNTNTTTTSKLANGQRNHLLRTYDGTNMYIYINGEQTRSDRIVGYYPTNSNPTYIGRSTNHGQLNGSIDELHVRNKFIEANKANDVYNTYFRKINGEQRSFGLTQTGLADGIYTLTGIVNGNNTFTGKIIIDKNAPIIEFTGYTGNEGSGLIINLTGYDEGTNTSGFNFRYKVPNTASWSNRTNRIRQSSGNNISIPTQNEPLTGTLEIEIRDDSNNKKTYSQNIERLNLAIITESLFYTGYEGSTITFIASGYDIGGTTNTGYQRYLSSDCGSGTSIIGANQKTFITGRNEPEIVTFGYKIKDAQDLRSQCTIATGNRTNVAPTAKDLYINASGNQYITFAATGSDPGSTSFSGQWYKGTTCTGNTLGTGLSFITGSEKSGTRGFSYHLRDAQGATGTNNTNPSRDCQIATGYRPFINPMANDFNISTETANKLITGDRRTMSQARDSEFNTTIIANISSGAKGYCQVTNDRVSFQPMNNQLGTGFCELTLTDGNNKSTIIKAYALNIDTTPPSTNISGQNYNIFTLQYQDISPSTSYYKILTGVWNASSCGILGYTPYTSGSSVSITYTPGITDYRTICYYSIDEHGNKETTKSQLFTQPQDAVQFNVTFSSNVFMNNVFEAIITTNKICTGTLTGLNTIKLLSLSPGTHTITGNFSENNGQKTAYITLQAQNTGEIFTRNHTFTIDQTIPSTPIITENTENANYYILRWNAATDDISGIKGYNYQIDNQYTTIKTGFTDVTYINILKSEVQYNNRIAIKIQAQDQVNNVSLRSNPRTITITQQTTPTDIDTIPNQFIFSKITNAKRDTLYTSNKIIIGGLSANTSIPIILSTGDLFINDSKINTNSGNVKNGDSIYIQLYSSDAYNDATQATLFANGISATYTVTTETSKASTTSFLDELKKLLEKLQKEEPTTTNPGTTDINIDTTWISAPHTAPNGKVYNLYKTIDSRYSSHNFTVKKYFTSLSEMKTYINKNNPR